MCSKRYFFYISTTKDLALVLPNWLLSSTINMSAVFFSPCKRSDRCDETRGGATGGRDNGPWAQGLPPAGGEIYCTHSHFDARDLVL